MSLDPLLPSAVSSDSVRRDNLAAVLTRVHRSGGLSRAALTESTGLNRSTIGALVGELAGLGLVAESDPHPTKQRGRPSPHVVPAAGPVAIAVNPEVDAVTIGLVGLGARVEQRWRLDVDHPVTPEQTAALVAETLARAPLAGRRILGIGLAVPGLVRERDGLVRWAPHLEWSDAELGHLVAGVTGLPTQVGNDASLGALAEHRFGAGRGVDDLVYLNGGASGIGGGVIIAARPLGGAGGYAGEFGHNRPGAVADADRVSSTGALEDEVSRARLLAVLGRTGADDPTLRRLLLESNDGAVAAELARQRRILGVALANAINVLNPAVVLLGGFLAMIRDADPAALDATVSEHAVAIAWSDARIESAALGDDLLMIGAAELAFAPLLADPARYA